jgi:hypothetical protein
LDPCSRRPQIQSDDVLVLFCYGEYWDLLVTQVVKSPV